jgi:cbb3-type cytochrome oxidase subunit 3
MNNYYIWLPIWLAISIWIYMDAKKRNLKNPAAWAVLGFLLGIIGLAGYWYWVLRPNKRDS